MSDFVWQCALFLLEYDLTYTVIGALAIVIVCSLVRFVIKLKEDYDEGNN